MKTKNITAVLFLLVGTFAACKKDHNEVELAKPTITNVEIGYANNKQAIRGRDFHLNADVVASNKITTVEVKILQKANEIYTDVWKYELTWDEFKGTRNTNVHKHFTIPATAPEGKYDFYLIVNDENGTKLELKEDFVILDAANMPVDPIVDRDIFSRNDDMIYYMNTYVENPLLFKKNDVFTAGAQIKKIQGNGILYTALIKRSLNHFPETVNQLDFSKCIIISKVEHKNLGPASSISTLTKINGVFGGNTITIGAEKDGIGNSISGGKAWESGQYNLVIVYHNSSYNMSTFKSIPLTIVY